jgi:DNA-binding NarL/FixJ family response regulator
MQTVLIVQRDPSARQKLEQCGACRRRELGVAAACTSAEEALHLVRNGLRFDVALLELSLAGPDVVRELLKLRPMAAVVALGPASPAFLDAVRAGARGGLGLEATPEQLGASVVEAARGGAPLAPSVARVLVDALAGAHPAPPGPPPPRAPELTPRELDVLQLLIKGVTYATVGHALGIGLGTVQSHVKRIYEKLEVSSKAEATAIALSYRLVEM